MPFDFSTWRSRLDQPIVNGLLLSLSLHLALLALVQPAPGGAGRGGPQPLVINARLVLAPANPVVKQVTAVSEPPLKALPPPPPETAKPPPQALLTSNVASPAPPVPLPPLPLAAPPIPTAGTPAANPVAAKPAIVAQPQNGASVPLGLGIDSTWYVARQVDVHARSLGAIDPVYPEEARRRSQEGSLKLMVKIDDLGRVHDVEVVEADLPGVFDAAALEAFRNAHFQPAMKDGRPVRYQAYIRVVFKLKD